MMSGLYGTGHWMWTIRYPFPAVIVFYYVYEECMACTECPSGHLILCCFLIVPFLLNEGSLSSECINKLCCYIFGNDRRSYHWYYIGPINWLMIPKESCVIDMLLMPDIQRPLMLTHRSYSNSWSKRKQHNLLRHPVL
jgi:hypothetical protein